MENTAIAWKVPWDSPALKPLGIFTVKMLRSLQPAERSERHGSTCIWMPAKREALYSDPGGPQPGSLPSSSKKAAEVFFPTHKTGAGKRRGFSPTASLPVPVRSPFQTSSVIYTVLLFQKTHFSKHPLDRTVRSVQIQGPWGPSHFTPTCWTGTSTGTRRLELCNQTKGHNTPWGQVLKAFQRKMAPNRSSSPPICSSSAKDLLALAVN